MTFFAKAKGVVQTTRELQQIPNETSRSARPRPASTDTQTTQTLQHDAEKDDRLSPAFTPTSQQEGLLVEPGPGEVDYRGLNWWHCGVLMIAECISLGVLSLPDAMAVLGLFR
jgi:hypothetical protein